VVAPAVGEVVAGDVGLFADVVDGSRTDLADVAAVGLGTG
jgi:hypothetical protein